MLKSTTKHKVFVTRKIAQEALDRIAQTTQMEVWPDELPPPYQVILEKAREASGLVTMLTDRIDERLMDAAPNLKIVSNMAVGYDNINIAAATKHHILVGNTPGVLTETTADLAFALLMSAARNVVEGDRYTRNGKWKTWGPQILPGQDIHHACLGIVGLGRIGLEIAKRARGFDMQVIYYDKVRRDEAEERKFNLKYTSELPELLHCADFISIHVPFTNETRHMFGETQFAMMKPNAVLINTSRGSVVDQKALYNALKSRQIFAAGLDVTEVEPIPMNDPLLTLDNVVITPHIASASFSTRRKMAMMAADNLLAGLRGELPPNCVNPEALKR